ncbi:MAG: AbrB/MazE/SpoVT family DNA-binding domain-containing protein [Betaproteobacteria bacterium]|nr:AbrB/MazE/SpoVT family DNA-binding domain-containing protein [Betaproteobacteria bacterium]NBT76190.1 AbrB/MazE/SpoVT family DNA-binding domain-containing protein [Betaproteobacteria bacterium]NCA15593.1 AbrB/MazE/SpoVT family DNA-binding domain-containing protein [Betaproteobacteria bacterium]
MTTVTLTKWGNSLGVRIPAEIVQRAELYAGGQLEVSTDRDGRIVLAPLHVDRKAFFAELRAFVRSCPQSSEVVQAMRDEARF